MIKYLFFIIPLLLTCKSLFAQSDNSKTIDYYFRIVDSLELVELKHEGFLTEKDSIAEQYFDKSSQRLNEKGLTKFYETRVKVYTNFYKDYLFLQSIPFNDDMYVLYFSVAGFEDVEFQIIKWKKKDWQKSYRLSKYSVDLPDQKFEAIAFNYDEGPKNLENVKLFIKNDYLVMERSGLYHSLYDLRTNKLILNINDESFINSPNAYTLEVMNKWIKDNIHSKIEEKINDRN